ncbi:WD40 associated region in TFIID subunit [Ostertagia ostertagi]
MWAKLGQSSAVSMFFMFSDALLSEFDSLIQFVDSSFDFFQAEFSLMLYPVFAHSYIKLLMENSVNNELVYNLERIQSAHQAQADTYIQLLMKNPFLVKMSKSSIKQLEIPLARTPTIKNIVKEHITIEASDVISKLRSSVESQMGGILGQVSKNEKRHKMYYGVLKDDVSQTIEKKKTRGKDLKDNKKSQALAPVPDRIPLPPLSEALREERRKAMRDAPKLPLVSQESPPSVCMLTALNAYGLVSSCDISDDSSILCMGQILIPLFRSSDGSIELTAFDEEQKLKKLRDMDALERGSICFSRDGGSFAVSQGGESLSVYSLDNLIAATSSVSSNNELCFDPKINMPNFNIFTYPTMQTAVIGLHFTRRNLLLAVGAYNS